MSRENDMECVETTSSTPNSNNKPPPPQTSNSSIKTPFNKVVGSKVERKTVIPDIHKMVNEKGFSRIYQFKTSPPIAFRTLIQRKFSSIYSTTFLKMKIGVNFYPAAVCLFEKEEEWNLAERVEVELGGKKIVLRAMDKKGESDNDTPKGIFVPHRLKKLVVKDLPWEMANYTCLQKVFSGYCTFDEKNCTLVLDREGRWNGSMVILVSEFALIPTRFFETALLDNNAQERDGITIQLEVYASGFAAEANKQDRKARECRYCHAKSHFVNRCPKLALKNRGFKCHTCGVTGECSAKECKNLENIIAGKLPKVTKIPAKPINELKAPSFTDQSSLVYKDTDNERFSLKRSRTETDQKWETMGGKGMFSARGKRSKGNGKSVLFNYDKAFPKLPDNDFDLSNPFQPLAGVGNKDPVSNTGGSQTTIIYNSTVAENSKPSASVQK